MKNKVSPELAEQAMKIAKGTQKAGQSKEQTKLIKQGIEKGIAEYKKQQNKKLRALDKQRQQQKAQKEQAMADTADSKQEANHHSGAILPWVLLGLSWIGFVAYHYV